MGNAEVVSLLIGPEGGWSQKEKELADKAGVGKRGGVDAAVDHSSGEQAPSAKQVKREAQAE